ncbi:MAG: hypothetical protein MZV63_23915 [Marinilabiliales bacterium]|nr:hypothetical protein [Marinilabiliales bacterium]
MNSARRPTPTFSTRCAFLRSRSAAAGSATSAPTPSSCAPRFPWGSWNRNEAGRSRAAAERSLAAGRAFRRGRRGRARGPARAERRREQPRAGVLHLERVREERARGAGHRAGGLPGGRGHAHRLPRRAARVSRRPARRAPRAVRLLRQHVRTRRGPRDREVRTAIGDGDAHRTKVHRSTPARAGSALAALALTLALPPCRVRPF